MPAISGTPTPQERYDQLAFYTLAHGHARFLHQHAVDAFTAQTATAETKTVALLFALFGLYLHVEKGFTGRQVQLAHMSVAKRRIPLPRPSLAPHIAAFTVEDVLAQPEGPARDQAISDWAAAVWASYAISQPLVRAFVKSALDIA